MRFAPYSPSKISTWESCPRKFDYYYVSKVPTKSEYKIHFTRGSIIHSFLENHSKSTVEKLAALKTDKSILKSPYYTKDMVKECFDVYKTFIATDLGKRLLDYKLLSTELSIALDKKLNSCDFWDENALFRGYIDAIFVDEETDHVYIVDWKTGKDRSVGLYQQSPDQLLMYAAWYFNHLPVEDLTIEYVFVEHNDAHLDFRLSRDRIEHYNKMLVKKILRIEKDTEFAKNEGPLCNYCEFYTLCNPPKPEINMGAPADMTLVIDEDEIPF